MDVILYNWQRSVLVLPELLISTADDGERNRKGLWGLERRQDPLCSYLQIHPKLRRIRRGDHQIQEEAQNASMVVHLKSQNSKLLLFFWHHPVELHNKLQHIIKCRCDRILWYGDGIEQLRYIRGESRFSDHRPVCALFKAQVETSDNGGRCRNGFSSVISRAPLFDVMPKRHSFYEY